ncbi:dTDP-4-amino-4,6-dideoxygalactose transaminase [Desulfacinum hydrothermale DSM 13146]|uniref:dTDP-4-amino-4,6-dideoxygalactose transaminase n=1 Tax=Desulfacinum hydrothermale DSM 13146 TaxID=1121390 RepID=A0A1W1XVK3_9BACT|nr:DegT/DnrJ/EryC1/StrS family aminotransferase [Desulfacinum hydrothermale]SMC27581.1 dTDP-4-amino-4,6-dideoxygalactose transaminase [Desulfacinum hydrothermale DSM 13146]
MEFIDLKAQQRRIRALLEERIGAVLDHGRYVLGPEVLELEEELARYTGVRHAVSCASGTDALLMVLMAWGIGPGHVVFTTPFTFIATAEVVALLGAVPVFVDVDRETFNMDPEKLRLALEALKRDDPSLHPLPEAARGCQAKAVIAVDLFGLPADYAEIETIAAESGLLVLEDAAQSFGASRNGIRAGRFGHAAATSFFPAKPLGGYGDGGMCFTDDDGLAQRLRSIRVHGQGSHRYDHVRLGLNGRLDTLQAAVLLAKMTIFDDELVRRRQVADRYRRLLERHLADLRPQHIPQGCTSAWAQFSLVAPTERDRDALRDRLDRSGIPTAVYYPVPLHLQPAFAPLGYAEGQFPVSEDLARRIFSLPMHPYLSAEEQERIVSAMAGDGP